MNKLVLLVGGAGIVAAGAALVLSQMSSPPPPQIVVQQAEAPVVPVKPRTVAVLVAARALIVGTTIAPEDLEWQEWPEGSVRRDQGIVMAMVDSERPEVMRNFTETVLRVPMVRGEPMVDEKVLRPGGGSLLALVLSPGTRSVTIAVDSLSGGGLIQPGDRIDLLLTSDLGDEGAGRIDPVTGKARPRLYTETVMTDLKVISADRRLSPSSAPDTPAPGNLTLEVSPEQAERIITAGRMGRFGAVVRPLRRGADPDREGPLVTTDVQITPRLNALRRGIGLSEIDPAENPFMRAPPPEPPPPPVPVAAPPPPPAAPPASQILMYRFTTPTTHTIVDGRIAGGAGGDPAMPMAPLGSAPPPISPAMPAPQGSPVPPASDPQGTQAIPEAPGVAQSSPATGGVSTPMDPSSLARSSGMGSPSILRMR